MTDDELPLSVLWLLVPFIAVFLNLANMLDDNVTYEDPTKTLFRRLWGTLGGLFFWILAFVSIVVVINHSAGMEIPRYMFLIVAINIAYLCAVVIEGFILLSLWANDNQDKIIKTRQALLQRILVTTIAGFVVSFVGFALGLTGGITLFSATIAGVLVFSISLFS